MSSAGRSAVPFSVTHFGSPSILTISGFGGSPSNVTLATIVAAVDESTARPAGAGGADGVELLQAAAAATSIIASTGRREDIRWDYGSRAGCPASRFARASLACFGARQLCCQCFWEPARI